MHTKHKTLILGENKMYDMSRLPPRTDASPFKMIAILARKTLTYRVVDILSNFIACLRSGEFLTAEQP